jgi:hypothetical protein
MLGLGGSETNIKAIITAEDKASSVLKGFGDNVGSLGSVVETGLKAGAVALAAAGAAAVGFGVVAVKAFSESQDLIAQTNAVLKSTGNAAGVTADQVTKLATALEKSTKFSDEQVRGAENMLLTFTAIGKDIFPQATKTVLDMSTALGEDTKSASIQLGKALQDPILGVTALRRVGVNFNQSQQDVIKNLVDTGKSAQAQQLILKELNKEFGGSAEAAGGTFSGSLAKLKNQLNNVEESMGAVLVKALTPLVTKFAEFVSTIDWDAVMKKATDGLKFLGRVMQDVVQTFKDPDVTSKGFFGGLEKVVSGVRHVFDGLVVVLRAVQKAWDFLFPSLVAVYHNLQKDLLPALERLWKDVIVPLAPVVGVILVGALWVLINALNLVVKAVSFVINIFVDLFVFMTKTLPEGITAGFNAVVEKVLWLKDNFWTVIGEIIGFMATLPIKLPILMVEAIVGIVKAVVSVDWGGVFSGIWHGMQWVWDRITDTVINAWHFIHDIKWGDLFTGIGKSLANGLIDLIEGALKGALKGLPGSIENKIHLPRFASGVKNFGGGLAIVGEQGAELVNLPAGSDVIPNNKISQAGDNNGTVNVVVNVGLYAGSEQEKRKIAMELLKSLQDIASSRSTTVGQMLGAA